MPHLDHFDILAPLYETFIPPRLPEKLSVLVDLPAGGTLLDAGGGTGRIVQFLYRKDSRVVVADQSFPMLREARKKDGLLPVCSQTEKLPFPDQTFDRIIMVDALHHVTDQPRTAEELWRLLQPGGRLVIEEPDVRNFGVRLIALAEKLLLMHSHFLSPTRIADLFHNTGAPIRIDSEEATAWVIVEKERG